MSTTDMLTGNALTQKLWAKDDWTQVSQASVIGHFFNRGCVYQPKEVTGSRKGDQITFSYVGKGTGKALGEGDTLSGNEESLELQNQSVVWNVQRYGFKNPNDEDTIEAQRTSVDFEESSREAIVNRYTEWFDTAAFLHLAGAAPTSYTMDGTTYNSAAEIKKSINFANTPLAPTTNRIIRPNTQATDQALGANDTIQLKHIDYLLEKAGNSTQMIPYLEGNEYDLFVSHEQLVDLQHDTTGPVQWYTNAIAILTNASRKDNRIENRFDNKIVTAGKYRNVNIYAHPRVAYGVNGSTSAVITTVRRAVMVGKDALIFACPFGKVSGEGKGLPLRYKTELQDYDYYKGIEGRALAGMVKNQPSNKEDIGVLVLSTYANTHA